MRLCRSFNSAFLLAHERLSSSMSVPTKYHRPRCAHPEEGVNAARASADVDAQYFPLGPAIGRCVHETFEPQDVVVAIRHRRAEPIVRQLDPQAEVDLEQSLGQLLHRGGIGKVQLAVWLQPVGARVSMGCLDSAHRRSQYTEANAGSSSLNRRKSSSPEYKSR